MGVLHETKPLANYIHRLRKQLYQVERDFDLTIEVNGYTKADLPDLEADKVTLLYGFLPSYMVRNKMNTLPKLLTIATLIIYTVISGINVDLDDSFFLFDKIRRP